MRREVRRPKVREVIPRDEVPNFRDHGKTVDRWLLDLLVRLQKKFGRAWASEAGLRFMIAQDTGHMPGVGTIPSALLRLAAQGLLVQVWLYAGQVKPDGGTCDYGTRLIRVTKTEKERSAARRFFAEHKRTEGVKNRLTGHDAGMLVARLGAAARPSMPPAPPEDSYRARAAKQLADLAELEARWAREGSPPKGRDPPE